MKKKRERERGLDKEVEIHCVSRSGIRSTVQQDQVEDKENCKKIEKKE